MRARDHRCDLTDLDYSDVEIGRIRCTVCPRQWILMVRIDPKTDRKFARWIAQPCPGCDASPCRCRQPARKPAASTKERWGDDD